MELTDGSRVGVIGGGPAGSLTAYFLLQMAEHVDLKLEIDVFEPRTFASRGPIGCNMCGGIVSESLVQMLATEGINLPPTVVQRGIESYVLHGDLQEVKIPTPLEEMRIATVYRGGGPHKTVSVEFDSFDGFLLQSACELGARQIVSRVEKVELGGDRPVIHAKGRPPREYDLVVGAVGINSPGIRLFEDLDFGFKAPVTTKTCITEIPMERDALQAQFGDAMHVFLLDIPRLEFAALIPKGEYVTACILGNDVDQDLLLQFMSTPEVCQALQMDWSPDISHCKCLPRISMQGAKQFFTDRLVLVGDCGVTRLYKDGIGAAYRCAKACATTAVLHGVSEQAFKDHYWPCCRRLRADNRIGKMIFMGVGLLRAMPFLRRAIFAMTAKEQQMPAERRAMSMILWDTFTGSAPYRSILMRGMHPGFIGGFAWQCVKSLVSRPTSTVDAQVTGAT